MNNTLSKLETLAENEGFDSIEGMMAELMYESVIPGICMNPDCDYTTNVEPDCHEGYCEICSSQSVTAATELYMGFI